MDYNLERSIKGTTVFMNKEFTDQNKINLWMDSNPEWTVYIETNIGNKIYIKFKKIRTYQ
jgi:hypothetical protein